MMSVEVVADVQAAALPLEEWDIKSVEMLVD